MALELALQLQRATDNDADTVTRATLGEDGREHFRLEIGASVDVAALNALGELLRDLRYEERTLFGRIEETLEAAELAALGSAPHARGAEHQPPRA